MESNCPDPSSQEVASSEKRSEERVQESTLQNSQSSEFSGKKSTQDGDTVEHENSKSPEVQGNSDDFVQEEADDCEKGLPITCLPEVALVHIMEYLTLKERYQLSMTCRLFYNLFSHPHLWQVAHILLLTQGDYSSGQDRMKWRLRSIMHQTMVVIVQRFSHMFQHLSLQLFGYVQPFDDNCLRLLHDLNEECRLESLSLSLGHLASSDDDIRRASARLCNYRDLPLVVGLVRKAMRLKRLSIVSWPLHVEAGDESDIFKALCGNEKLKSLESLSLFYVEVKRDQWTDRIPKLPSVETTLHLISHCQNLSHLALRSPMLGDEIFIELASKRRNKLSVLQILIMYSRDSFLLDGYKVPEISSQAWLALRTASPHLKVEYLVLTRIPQEHLGLMLKPEVPLSSLTILTYGRCDVELIENLSEKYKRSLEKFISFCDSSDCGEALLRLVQSCKKLTHLAYHGDIHYKTVIKIAETVRDNKQEYSCFEFKEKNIQIGETAEGIEDDDVVVAKDPERQEYYLVGLRAWHRDEDERRKLLDVMSDRVSQALGYKWHPWTS